MEPVVSHVPERPTWKVSSSVLMRFSGSSKNDFNIQTKPNQESPLNFIFAPLLSNTGHLVQPEAGSSTMPVTHCSAAHGIEAVFLPPSILNEGRQECLSKACYRWRWRLREDLPVDVRFSFFGQNSTIPHRGIRAYLLLHPTRYLY